eukprot:13723116-Heterocapsa_arctica.AAC.1
MPQGGPAEGEASTTTLTARRLTGRCACRVEGHDAEERSDRCRKPLTPRQVRLVATARGPCAAL